MKVYRIIAYAEPRNGLKRDEAIVRASDHNNAISIGWKLFPEYHQIAAFEAEGEVR